MNESIDSIKTRVSNLDNLNLTKINNKKDYSISKSHIDILNLLPEEDE